MVEIDTLKTAKKKPPKKNMPFAAAHTYIAYIRDYAPPLPRRKTRRRFESRCFRKRDY